MARIYNDDHGKQWEFGALDAHHDQTHLPMPFNHNLDTFGRLDSHEGHVLLKDHNDGAFYARGRMLDMHRVFEVRA